MWNASWVSQIWFSGCGARKCAEPGEFSVRVKTLSSSFIRAVRVCRPRLHHRESDRTFLYWCMRAFIHATNGSIIPTLHYRKHPESNLKSGKFFSSCPGTSKCHGKTIPVPKCSDRGCPQWRWIRPWGGRTVQVVLRRCFDHGNKVRRRNWLPACLYASKSFGLIHLELASGCSKIGTTEIAIGSSSSSSIKDSCSYTQNYWKMVVCFRDKSRSARKRCQDITAELKIMHRSHASSRISTFKRDYIGRSTVFRSRRALSQTY